MRGWFGRYRELGQSAFPRHQRGVDVLGVVSIVVLLGVSVSGAWQFFAYESDPLWFNYVPGVHFGAVPEPPRGMQLAHNFFGTAAGVVALAGTSWFAYNVSHRIPITGTVALACTVFALFTQSAVRFKVIKLEGRSFEEAGTGYPQVFSGDVEYVVTGIRDFSPLAFQILVVAHVLTVPILVGFAWWSIGRAIERRRLADERVPKRTWARPRLRLVKGGSRRT